MTGPMLPTSRQLAWLLVQPVLALDAAALAVVALVEQDETAATVARLARLLPQAMACSSLSSDGNAEPRRIHPGARLERWFARFRA